MTRYAHNLVTRLRKTQAERQRLAETKDHVGAHRMLNLAVSLVDPCDLVTLREALLHATNPANVPPIPVVFGPQDVAAVVSRDELLALVHVYATAYIGWGRGDTAAEQRCVQAYRELRAAVEALCQAVPVFEAYGDGRSS